MAPSAPPAPMIVCTSSRKRMIFPSAFTSRISPFIRSSNSPLYLEPATMPARSIVYTFRSFMLSGTAPAAIFRASPSMTAVFPTPGSPTRQGLFFVLLLKICISLFISASRPMTGSSPPSAASSVKSVPYCSKIPPFLPGPACCISSWYSFGLIPITARTSWNIFCTFKLSVISILVATHSTSRKRTRSMCSVPVFSARSFCASSRLSSRIHSSRGLYFGLCTTGTSPEGDTSSSTIFRMFSSSTPFAASICPATPVYTLRSPIRRCSVPT